MKDLRIIFMGTPEFAIPSLNNLIEHDFNIVGVITAPDKPRGRGRVLTPSPVKKYAVEKDITVLQPTNLKNPEFIQELKTYKPDLQVVVAFRMLPEVVWSLPGYGTFNLHASLLPQYRGAAPINWVIINGEKKTGLTTFFIKHQIDTGNIIFQTEEPVYIEDDAESLHDRLMESGARLVLKTVQAIRMGNVQVKQQVDEPGLKLAPKLTREICEIDWSLPGVEIVNFIRGLSPYPGAWTIINNRVYKIFKVSLVHKRGEGNPGTFDTDDKSYLHFQSGDYMIQIEELQPEGKKKMNIEEFLRGNTI